jgi:uncharacterized protein (TIGR00251 family)
MAKPVPIAPQMHEAIRALESPNKFFVKSVGGTVAFIYRRDARPVFIYGLIAFCMPLPPYLMPDADGVCLSIKLQPRASGNQIGEPMGNELRIKVTAPPVDSAANEALIEFLAEKLDCARNRVELLRGHTSRHKVIKLHGITPEAALAKLAPGS